MIYESLAAGTTVLTTKGVDTWPELESQAHATICDQRAEAIAELVAALTSDPARLGELGRRGREWIFENQHPDQIIARFEQFYQRAASR